MSEPTRAERRDGPCEICDRKKPLTFHHLIPKMVHNRKRYQKRYTKQELNTGLYICKLCHDGIHDYFKETELAANFNTKELLLGHEGFKKHVAWTKKQK